MFGYTMSVYLCSTCGTFRALTGTTECRWCRGPVEDVTPEPTDAELVQAAAEIDAYIDYRADMLAWEIEVRRDR